MSQTYTYAFSIPTSGTSSGCMALHNSTGSPITAVVVPWVNLSGATAPVAIPAGGILPLKVREVKSGAGAGLVGLN
jgi:hypothetical protein